MEPGLFHTKLPLKAQPFPWREGNHFQLLVDGEQFFTHMLAAIEAARSHVLMEMYLINSGQVASRFIEAFCAAATRGVQTCLLLDDFGCLELVRNDRQRLREAGVQIAYYNPIRLTGLRRNLFRNHRKLLVVDGQIAYVGGMGLTDDFARTDAPSWHEVVVAIQGPVVSDWQQTFLRSWNLWSRISIAPPLPPNPHCGHQTGRLSLSAGLQRTEIKRTLLNQIRGANRRIWISTAYFIPSRRLRTALRQAARAGLDVRLLLSGPATDHPAVRQAGRRFYSRLLQHGVRIFEYQPRFLHAKMQLCDDWASIGSSNVDRWNLRWNLEANQEVADRAFAIKVQALFEHDFAQSEEFTYETWIRRSRWKRLLEWWWGWVDLWMERISQHRR